MALHSQTWMQEHSSQLAMCTPKQKNTCVWVNNPTQQRKEQTMEALREEKQLRFCPWMSKQQKGREFAVVGAQQLVERKMNVCERDNGRFSFPFRSQLWVECAWGQGLKILPPHSQNQLTASTTSSNSSMRVVGIKTR